MRLLLWGDPRLSQPPAPLGQQLPDDLLEHVYAAPKRWVRANMVSTVDGSGVDAHGLTGGINTPADHRVFGLLRALSDVVLIGAGTARTEGYSRIAVDPGWLSVRQAHGFTAPPVLAVPTASGELPDSLLSATPDGSDVLVLVGPEAPAAAVAGLRRRLGSEWVVAASDRPMTPVGILAALTDRGLTSVLLEGGPSLLHAVLDAGLLDELCLTWTPMLIGGPSGRILSGGSLLRTLTPTALLEEEGTLLGRWSVD